MSAMAEYAELHNVISRFYDDAVRACVEHEVLTSVTCTVGHRYLAEAMKETAQYIGARSIGLDAVERLNLIVSHFTNAVVESRRHLVYLGVTRAHDAVMEANEVAQSESQVEQTRKWVDELTRVAKRAAQVHAGSMEWSQKDAELREAFFRSLAILEDAEDARADWV